MSFNTTQSLIDGRSVWQFSVQADEETYSLEETILIREPKNEKKTNLFDWGVFSGERFTGQIFLRGLQDGYLRSKPHAECEHFL